jgi:two-component system sensor histidine kinase/response regulator
MSTESSFSHHDVSLPELLKMPTEKLQEAVILFWQERNQKKVDSRLLRELVLSYAGLEKSLRMQNEAQKRMLAIAAHDLHNPIVSIRGLAELILASPANEPLEQHRELLAAILSAAEGMQFLVANLLELGTLDSMNFSLTLTPQSLSRLVEERALLFGTQIRNKQMNLQLAVENSEPFLLDKSRMTQVIDNLLSNAIKFSPAGSTIRVRLTVENNSVVYSVFDQGPGISEADREKLFKSFQKLSATPTGGEKSTGLGLSIVKRISELHGGHVHAQNCAEGGCVFSVKLPIRK